MQKTYQEKTKWLLEEKGELDVLIDLHRQNTLPAVEAAPGGRSYRGRCTWRYRRSRRPARVCIRRGSRTRAAPIHPVLQNNNEQTIDTY